MRFENKTVFITGAGSGIGRATAIQCAREDAYVVVTDIVEDGAIETAEAIEDLETGRAEARRPDVTEGMRSLLKSRRSTRTSASTSSSTTPERAIRPNS